MTGDQIFFEWIKAASTIVAALSLALACASLITNIRWNRKNATFTYLPESTYIVREQAAADALKNVDLDLYKQVGPIDAETVDKIMDNSDVYREVKHFLNIFEDYCVAYSVKAINRTYAYSSNAGRFIRFFDIFAPLINRVREKYESHSVKKNTQWEHFENVVAEWRARKSNELT